MLGKIKNVNPWIIALLFAFGIEILFSLIVYVLNINFRQFFGDMGLIFALPGLKISGYETVQAINNFRGDPADLSMFTEVAVTTGISIFVIFILGPFLLLKGYVQSDASNNPKKKNWVWYTGAILIMMTIVPAVISTTVGTAVHLNIRESTEDSRQKDQLRTELMNLALDASYLIFAPKEIGGGEGSFKTMGEESEPIKLENLDSYQSDSNYEFQLFGEVKDSVITIVGVSSRPGREESFENITGKTGKHQISVTVTPYKENIFKMDGNSSLHN